MEQQDVLDDSELARAWVSMNLRALLRLRGVSLRWLAKRTGISRSWLQATRAGRANIGIDHLDRIADALEVMTWRMLAPAPPPPAHIKSESNLVSARSLLAVRLIRESNALGLTMGDVARLSESSPGHVYDIVARDVSVGIDLLPALARALRIELHLLLRAVAET